MEQLKPYEHDIFISYAHIDDTPLMAGEGGWVSEFHKSMEALVKQILGEELNVWRDPKLQGNDYFSDTLVDAVPKAAVLVSIVSPRYLKSEWCLRELDTFSKETDGARIENKSRIFKVVKTPVERNNEPAPLNQLLGYEFFKIDNASGKPTEFRIEFGPESKQHYLAKMYDLAYEIAEAIKQIANTGTHSDSANTKAPVYLAESSSDLSEQRESVKAELRQLGYTILPDKPLPIESEHLRKAVQADLDQCSLSIHMIGANHSFIPEGDQRSIVRLQNDIAASHCRNKPLQRLIWLAPSLTPSNDRQRKLMEYLQTDSDSIEGADVLMTNLEELKTVIQDKLKDSKPDKVTDNNDLENLDIYLVCDQCDFDETTPLSDYLYDQGLEVVLPVFEGDEAQVREDHADKLLSSDIIFIYQGKASDLWLSSKLRDLKKLPGFDGYKPKLATVVYEGSPATQQKERFRSRDSIIIKNFDTFTPQSLEPLMSAVKQSQSGHPE